MKRKGQASIEFILLIVVVLLYLQTVVQPTVIASNSAALEVNRAAKARSAAETLANSINSVSVQGDQSKQTVQIFVPVKSRLLCKCPKIVPDPIPPAMQNCQKYSNILPVTTDLNAIRMEVELELDPPLVIDNGTSSGQCAGRTCYYEVPLFSNTNLDCSDSDLSDGFRSNVTYAVSVRKDGAGVVHVEV